MKGPFILEFRVVHKSHTLRIVQERFDIRQISVIKVIHVKRKRSSFAIPVQNGIQRQSGVADVLDERGAKSTSASCEEPPSTL